MVYNALSEIQYFYLEQSQGWSNVDVWEVDFCIFGHVLRDEGR